jgi:hypothetical protein
MPRHTQADYRRVKVVLRFPGNVPTVTETDRPRPGRFTGEFGTLKTESDLFGKSTVRDFAELILSGPAAFRPIRTLTFYHPRAFFTGNSTNSDFHGGDSLKP